MVEEPLGKKAPYIGPSKIQPLQPKKCDSRYYRTFSRYYRTLPALPDISWGSWGSKRIFSLRSPVPKCGTAGPRYYRILVRYYRTSQNENSHNFCIRTPISMILGSFRRGQQPLQDHAKKHHSPEREDRSKLQSQNLLPC